MRSGEPPDPHAPRDRRCTRCTGSFPQKFTIRPHPFIGADRLHVEVYGMLEDRLSLPLKETATGKKFSFSRGALAVAGELLSHDAQSGAVVRMDKVEWDGTSICDSGTYTFPVEE